MDSYGKLVVIVLGAVLILIGIVGGGLEIKEIKIPKVESFPRWAALLIGLVILGYGTTMDGSPPAEAKVIPPAVAEAPSGDSGAGSAKVQDDDAASPKVQDAGADNQKSN